MSFIKPLQRRLVKFYLLLFLALLTVSLHTNIHADALMVNKAMQASSIAEYYIDQQSVTVELEIGLGAVDAFKALLPDTIFEKMGYGNIPLNERLPAFFEQQLGFMDDQEKRLTGSLVSISPSKRVLRDPVNGTPLPSQDGAPDVIKVTLRYTFPDSQPASLIFISPPAQDIGFVAYHNGVAINDFRYLSPGLVLELDWHDPWYSSFTTRNMKRRYSEPMSGFIYVEPFEIRKEIIARPKDLQRWVDLDLKGKKEITLELQGQIKEKVAEFLAAHHPVSIDGKAVQGTLDSINFLERTLTSSRVIDTPEPLNIDSAIIGAIFIYPRNGELPQKVVMDWDIWDERIRLVPVSAVDQAGPLPSFLEPDWNQLIWENFLMDPEIPQFNAIASPVKPWQVLLYHTRAIFAVLVLVGFAWLVRQLRQRKTSTLPVIATSLMLAGCTASFGLGASNQPQQKQAEAIIGGLLHNIYRAFDYREESEIYDVLDRSIAGELLTDIYLETKRSLVLTNQGGARAKVKSVELMNVTLATDGKGERFTANATWVVNGSVGHWGHVHQRNNRYQAKLTIAIVNQQWKFEQMTVLNEERL